MAGNDVVIKLIAQGSQEVVAAVRAVKDEIKSLATVGASAPGTSAFQNTATQAAELATSLSTVTDAARSADQAIAESAVATTQLAQSQQLAVEQTAKLSGEARTAAAQIANAVQTTTRALSTDLGSALSQANLGEQARQAALEASQSLETGLRGTVANLREQLAAGTIDPAAFKAQADAAVAAFGTEFRTLIASLPPATIPVRVDDNVISEEALQTAEKAFSQSGGIATASEALNGLNARLAQTVAEFQANGTAITEFNAALGSIRSDAITALGSASNLTAEDIAGLNAVVKQTEQLGAVGFDAILTAIREADTQVKIGTLTVEGYQKALAAARTEAIALANATGDLSGVQLTKLSNILTQTSTTAPQATRGLGTLRSGMSVLAFQAAGLTSSLGSVGQGLALVAAGTAAGSAIVIGLAALILLFQKLTEATRKAKEEQLGLVEAQRKRLDTEDTSGRDAQRAANLKRILDLEKEIATFRQQGAAQGNANLFATDISRREREIAALRTRELQEQAADAAALQAKQVGGTRQAQADELAILQAGLASQESILKSRFDRELVSRADFYKQRIGLAREAVAAEIAALTAQRDEAAQAPAFTKAEQAERAAQVAHLEKMIELATLRGEQRVREIADEQKLIELREGERALEVLNQVVPPEQLPPPLKTRGGPLTSEEILSEVATKEAEARSARLADAIERDRLAAEEFAHTVTGSVAVALTDFFGRGITQGETFLDLIRNIAAELQRVAARLIFANLFGGGNAASALVGSDFGLSAPAALARGGVVRGPGTSTSDSILAWLSNGEFVIPADAVRYYGLDRLDRLRLQQAPRFAQGGMVGSLRSPEPVTVNARADVSGRILVEALPGTRATITDAEGMSFAVRNRKALRDLLRE